MPLFLSTRKAYKVAEFRDYYIDYLGEAGGLCPQPMPKHACSFDVLLVCHRTVLSHLVSVPTVCKGGLGD